MFMILQGLCCTTGEGEMYKYSELVQPEVKHEDTLCITTSVIGRSQQCISNKTRDW